MTFNIPLGGQFREDEKLGSGGGDVMLQALVQLS